MKTADMVALVAVVAAGVGAAVYLKGRSPAGVVAFNPPPATLPKPVVANVSQPGVRNVLSDAAGIAGSLAGIFKSGSGIYTSIFG